jgi:hypothetical protein
MSSVTCKIKSKKNPEKWVEVEIGVDDGSRDNFWRLTAKSTVAFHQFNATSGRWDPLTYYGGSPAGGSWGVPSILLFSADQDPWSASCCSGRADHPGRGVP